MTFPRPRLCLGQKWNPVPEIKYNTFHVRVNAGNRPDYRFFPGNWRFFNMYKFAVQVSSPDPSVNAVL